MFHVKQPARTRKGTTMDRIDTLSSDPDVQAIAEETDLSVKRVAEAIAEASDEFGQTDRETVEAGSDGLDMAEIFGDVDGYVEQTEEFADRYEQKHGGPAA